MMNNLLEAMCKRRSCYTISKELPISDRRLEELLGEAIRQTPTAFNMQSPRVVLLLGEDHTKLWQQIVVAALKKEVPPEHFGRTQQKIDSFAAGHGTILYFDDTEVTQRFANENPLYKDNFPVWAQQQNGMLQYAVWTILAEEGVGASLQHYNPLIDEDVYATWDIPRSWQLIAQMPFGKPTAPSDDKDYQPLSERMRVFG